MASLPFLPWIQQHHASGIKIPYVTRDQNQLVMNRCRRDQRIGMWAFIRNMQLSAKAGHAGSGDDPTAK